MRQVRQANIMLIGKHEEKNDLGDLPVRVYAPGGVDLK
jgi:hypothetical protein